MVILKNILNLCDICILVSMDICNEYLLFHSSGSYLYHLMLRLPFWFRVCLYHHLCCCEFSRFAKQEARQVGSGQMGPSALC